MKDHLEEECANCGLTFGSHYAGAESWPKSYCPGHEGKMDWEEGPGTTFKPTGARKKTKIYGQTAKNYHNPQGFNKKGPHYFEGWKEAEEAYQIEQHTKESEEEKFTIMAYNCPWHYSDDIESNSCKAMISKCSEENCAPYYLIKETK